MKIKYGELKMLIKEVALSPALFRNNKPHKDPLDDKDIANSLQSLERAFKRDALMNILLLNADKYNTDSREFDDETYKQIEDAASETSELVAASVNDVVKQAWKSVHDKTKKN
jgi:hypothetical protein